MTGFTPLGTSVIVLALAAFALRVDVSTQAAAKIQVTPTAVVEGNPVTVTITGLKPGQEIVLHACRLWDLYPKGSEPYYSRTTFVADAGGSVSTNTSRPLINGGEAPGDPSRPFWSMASIRLMNTSPPAASCDVASLRADEVKLAVEATGQLVAHATAVLATSGPEVTVTEVQTADVVGVFAAPPAGPPRPGVILLGGSEGGLFTARSLAPLFASHGFATLGVGYFGGDLPGRPGNLALIPVETVEHARQWLHAQPGVDRTRIAIVGVSKGAELALVAASQYQWIDVVAALRQATSLGRHPAGRSSGGPAVSSWTVSGRPMPFVRWSYGAEARATEAERRRSGPAH